MNKPILVTLLLVVAALSFNLPANGKADAVIKRVAVFEKLTAYKEGDTVRVELCGTAGGTATFDVQGVQAGIPMQELCKGCYRGAWRVPTGVRVQNAHVIGHLRIAGTEVSRMANAHLTIGYAQPASGYHHFYPVMNEGQGTRVLFITMTGPLPGAAVANQFTVTGRTLPNVAVLVSVRLRNDGKSHLVNTSAMSDRSGEFSVPVSFVAGVVGHDLAITVTAMDPMNPTNCTSEEVEFDVATGGE